MLLHGFRGAPVGLKAIQQELEAAGYRVYVPAVPPFAGASALTEYTPWQYAQFVVDYIHEQNLQQPILVGHSMGSLVAAATAFLRPEEVNRKLVLLSPISAEPARFFQWISPLSAYLPPRLVDYITTRFLFVPHDAKKFRETLRLTAECSGDRPPRQKDLVAAAKFAARHALTNFPVHQQVTLIAGAKDRLIRRRQTEKLAQEWGAQAVFLDGCGHLHNYEQPRETAQAIIAALR